MRKILNNFYYLFVRPFQLHLRYILRKSTILRYTTTTRNVKFVEFYRIRRILYRKEILGTRWINSKIRGTFEKYDEIIAPISPLDSLIALQICFYLEGWFCFPWHCTTYILRSKTNLLRFWNEVIWLRFVNYISNNPLELKNLMMIQKWLLFNDRKKKEEKEGFRIFYSRRK